MYFELRRMSRHSIYGNGISVRMGAGLIRFVRAKAKKSLSQSRITS